MEIRDRIQELRRVAASRLRRHPKNWRTHPPRQVQALRAVLADVGWAGVVLARNTPHGLELIDGHLRVETAGDAEIPVLVLDLNDEEAEKILATYDPLAALAGVDAEKLTQLLDSVEFGDEVVVSMINDLAAAADVAAAVDVPLADHEPSFGESFQVVVQCDSETQQQEVYEMAISHGYQCRLLTI